MENPFKNPKVQRYAPLIVFVLGIFLLMPGIWSQTGITAKDEYWLSLRTPLETMARGDWLTTWVNGEPRLKKPPLLYWAIMAGYKIFGINLFAARIWGVLAGAGLALCACLIARRLFGKDGLIAGLLTLASIGVAVEARQAMLDLPLAFFSCLATWFALSWWKTNRIGWILGCAVSLGLSFLVKGPIGLFFFGISAATALFVFRKWKDLSSRLIHIGCASLVLAALCLPWPIAMAHLWPNFSKVMHDEAGQRHFGRVDLYSPFSALGGALGLVFPWTLVLIAAILKLFKRAGSGVDKKSLWLATWYGASVLPLFFMESFERYMLPVIPPMCILCANWLEGLQGSEKSTKETERAESIVFQVSIILVALAAVALCAVFLWFGIAVRSSLISLSLVAIMLLSAFLTRIPHATVLAVALLFASMLGEMYPAIGIAGMPAGIEAIVGARQAAVYATSQPAMLSVWLKRSVIPLNMRARSGPLSLEDFDGFVFMESTEAPKFEAAAGNFPVTIRRAGSFKTFFSRKVWVRFARRDATWRDWKKAIRSHSLEDLKAEVVFYRVSSKEPHS